jgi:hypothetical protein
MILDRWPATAMTSALVGPSTAQAGCRSWHAIAAHRLWTFAPSEVETTVGPDAHRDTAEPVADLRVRHKRFGVGVDGVRGAAGSYSALASVGLVRAGAAQSLPAVAITSPFATSCQFRLTTDGCQARLTG